MELSPGSFRTFVVGTAYQLGNLVSSASSTIESTIGERFPLAPLKDGSKVTQVSLLPSPLPVEQLLTPPPALQLRPRHLYLHGLRLRLVFPPFSFPLPVLRY